MKKQSGFTLIELAIVLVIIGLLLGGVLKGQELINSAKVKNMASDFRNIQVQIYSYQDKFKALPGDDKGATVHLAGTGVTPTNGDGDGVIEGAWNSTTTGDESFNVWQQLRLANLATGSTNKSDATYQPTNTEGGVIGVQSNPNLTITGLSGSYAVCSTGILGKFAKQLDATLDDGDTASGSMRAVITTTPVIGTTAVNPTTLATIVDSSNYTVCMAF